MKEESQNVENLSSGERQRSVKKMQEDAALEEAQIATQVARAGLRAGMQE